MEITNKMKSTVLNALVVVIRRKGDPKRMAHLEELEEAMFTMGIDFFVPTRSTLDILIQSGDVSYFTMKSGRIVFGLRPKHQHHVGGTQYTQGSETTQDSKQEQEPTKKTAQPEAPEYKININPELLKKNEQ